MVHRVFYIQDHVICNKGSFTSNLNQYILFLFLAPSPSLELPA